METLEASESGFVAAVLCSREGSAVLCRDRVPVFLSPYLVERRSCPDAGPRCLARPRVAVIGSGRRVDAGTIRRALRDFGGCVQAKPGALPIPDDLGSTLAEEGLYVGLPTASAFPIGLAGLFTEALAQRIALDDRRREAVEMALNEAVANAAVHGNLGIGPGDHRTLDDFSRYYDEIDRTLADPRLGQRWIEIFASWTNDVVYITVRDEGEGFDPWALYSEAEESAKCGRGFPIIRSLTDEVIVRDEGRGGVCMVFAL